jgi:hypothetical protein
LFSETKKYFILAKEAMQLADILGGVNLSLNDYDFKNDFSVK